MKGKSAAKAVKPAPKPVRQRAGGECGRWRDIGDEISKHMEEGGREFGQEMESLGTGLRRRFEEKKRMRREREMREKWGRELREERWERAWDSWWFNTFGFVSPIIGSVFGLLWLLLAIWIINLVNVPLGTKFLPAITAFLWANMGLFFAASVFFGYARYFSRRFTGVFWFVSPLVNAAAVVFALWVCTAILDAVNAGLSYAGLAAASLAVQNNLYAIFIVMAVLGYAFAFTKRLAYGLFRYRE